MKLSSFAESLAIKTKSEEDYGVIESYKFDILGYRASIIARLDSNTAPEIYYQYLSNFVIEESKTILDTKYSLIKIPKLIAFKNNKFAIKAFNKIGNLVVSIDVIDEELGEYVSTGNRYTSKIPRLIYSNNSLTAVNFQLSSLKGLTIGAIFNNPLDLNVLKDSCTVVSNCFVGEDEEDLDIEDSLYQQIVIFMYKQLGLEQNNIITTAK